MLRDNASTLRSLIAFFDVVAAIGIFLGINFSDATGFGSEPEPLFLIALLNAAAWPIALNSYGLYTSYRLLPLLPAVVGMLRAGVAVALVTLTGAFVFSAPFSPATTLACLAAQCVVLGGPRLLAMVGLRVLRQRGRNYRNLIILGSGARALEIAHGVRKHPEWGLRLVGFVDVDERPRDARVPERLFHPIAELPELLRQEVIDEVVVTLPRSLFGSLDFVASCCANIGVPVTILSDFFGEELPAPRPTRFGPHPALSFAPVHHSRGRLAVKRGLDVVLSGVLVVLTAPLAVAAAVAIRLDSPGPIVYRQVRCGLRGRRFELLKLRTMCADAEERRPALEDLNEMEGPVFKIRNDPRVTRVGRVVRRWSIDELPQLWNVLKGEMSLVGPRPPVPDEVSRYEMAERRRLSMRPGLTCSWQVGGRNDIKSFSDWVKLDLEYIDNWSLWEDMKLMARTVPTVVLRRGAS
jgi:exopolysaccharide biosynthesis polyprenyl glycosylphosphotransferase